MQIDVIPEIRLTACDDAEIGALLTDAFGPEFNGRSFHKQRHHLRILVRDEGAIMGHLALLVRDIRIGDHVMPIIGVAEVTTRPDRRGQGVASMMLAAAIAEARASLADFIVLFGDRPLYVGAGFMKASNTLTYALLDDLRSQGTLTRVDDGLMILPLRGAVWDPEAPVDLVGHIF